MRWPTLAEYVPGAPAKPARASSWRTLAEYPHGQQPQPAPTRRWRTLAEWQPRSAPNPPPAVPRGRADSESAKDKDSIAYFGDPAAGPAINTGLKKEFRELVDMPVSEKVIEDYLEAHPDFIGSKIGTTLQLIGRQYPTPVGVIDLLARDKKTGEYVVIELKKGHGADTAFGQLSRYMGWARNNLADGVEVQGVIVARRIDDKLRAARDAHDTKVHFVEFETKLGAKVV